MFTSTKGRNKMEKFNESMIGRKVRFTNAMAHEEEPWFYPEVGTIGTIVSTKGTDFENMDDLPYVVQWPEGTTSEKDLWAVDDKNIELVDEEMVTEDVFDMIKYISIDSFLKTLLANIWGMDLTNWVVSSVGSRVDVENKWFWLLRLKNIETKEEKRIKIPMYRD